MQTLFQKNQTQLFGTTVTGQQKQQTASSSTQIANTYMNADQSRPAIQTFQSKQNSQSSLLPKFTIQSRSSNAPRMSIGDESKRFNNYDNFSVKNKDNMSKYKALAGQQRGGIKRTETPSMRMFDGARNQLYQQRSQVGRASVILNATKNDDESDFTVERLEEGNIVQGEIQMDDNTGKKEFTLSKPQYDQSTFTGRLLATAQTQQLQHNFYSKTKILQFKQLLDDTKAEEEINFQKTGKRSVMLTPEQIKEVKLAELVTRSALNPDSGALIPWIARISSFIPCNMPIVYGFILSAPTPFNTIFWQWFCQTYNSYLNWGNASASDESSTSKVLKSYLGAVTVALSVGLLTRRALAPFALGLPPTAQLLVNTTTSFAACASSSFINVIIMRGSEMFQGIDVFDPKDLKNPVYRSKKAGRRAVFQTAISRVVMGIPLFYPPLAFLGLSKLGLLPKGIALKVLEFAIITSQLFISATFGAASFPQISKIKTEDICQEAIQAQPPNEQTLMKLSLNQVAKGVDELQYNRGQ